MTCTMLVAAPIMCVGGIVMALRQDVGLSWLMVVSVPVAADRRSARSSRGWCRSSGRCRPGIDGVNRVLREQITGIRVVRAFVREPATRRAVRATPTPTLTDDGAARRPAAWR